MIPSTPILRSRTASRFGYLWSRSDPQVARHAPLRYHVQVMEHALAMAPSRGWVLDAGCGEGIDLAVLAARPGVRAVGLELSDGGCRISAARIAKSPNAWVVHGDVCRLPFPDGRFDVVYSYGVLHHVEAPEAGMQELARVLAPGGTAAVYLYEDFSERAAGWRVLLRMTNALRGLTTRMPEPLLYAACLFAAPIAYLLFTVPAMLLGRFHSTRRLAESLPFRHGRGPLSLVGDLYDRFSAPIERRYSRAQAAALVAGAGLGEVRLVARRGWVIAGRKPAVMASETPALLAVAPIPMSESIEDAAG